MSLFRLLTSFNNALGALLPVLNLVNNPKYVKIGTTDNEKRIRTLAEEKYQVLFGVRKPTFKAMLAILEAAYEEMRKKGGRRRKLSVLDMLIAMRGYVRHVLN